MKRLYNITVSFEGLGNEFKMELRNIFKHYKVEYNMSNYVKIRNADERLIEHLEQWDIIIKENI